jgi:hypothetical protein
MSVSSEKFVKYFEDLYNNGAIYLWGANGETITKTLTDKLYKQFGSATYNKDYYNAKLAEGKGKIGADCSGAFYPLSGVDRSASGFYNDCTEKGLIGAIPKNKVCMVFNKNLTHMGAYLGNGCTVEMRDSKLNVYKEDLKISRWYYYGIPSFVEYTETEKATDTTSSDVIVTNYQTWVNTKLGKEEIKVDGSYGDNTLKATVKVLQTLFVKEYKTNTKLSIDGKYGTKTIAACPAYSAMKKNTTAFADITYIVHVYLYAVMRYDMKGIINSTKVSTNYSDITKAYVSKYQNDTRGLAADGYAGSATLRAMFASTNK